MGSFCCSLTSVWSNFKAICFRRAPCPGCLWCRGVQRQKFKWNKCQPVVFIDKARRKASHADGASKQMSLSCLDSRSWETREATRPNDQWQPWESIYEEMKTHGCSLLKTCLEFIDTSSLTQLPHLANRQASNNPTSRNPLNKFPFITRTRPERLKQNRQVILVMDKLDEGFFFFLQMIRSVMRTRLCSESSVAGSRDVSGPGLSRADHIWQCAFPV